MDALSRTQRFALQRLTMDMGYRKVGPVEVDDGGTALVRLVSKLDRSQTVKLHIQRNGEWVRA